MFLRMQLRDLDAPSRTPQLTGTKLARFRQGASDRTPKTGTKPARLQLVYCPTFRYLAFW